MPDCANITIPSFPQCPDCSAEAHVLTFHPIVDAEDTRVLSEFAWRCPNGHKFEDDVTDQSSGDAWAPDVTDQLAELLDALASLNGVTVTNHEDSADGWSVQGTLAPGPAGGRSKSIISFVVDRRVSGVTLDIVPGGFVLRGGAWVHPATWPGRSTTAAELSESVRRGTDAPRRAAQPRIRRPLRGVRRDLPVPDRPGHLRCRQA